MKDVQLINNVKRLFPDKAIDLSESLELVLDCIDETVAEIKQRIDLAVTERNFEDVRSFAEMAEALSKYETEITSIRNALEPDNSSKDVAEGEDEGKSLPNYEDYYVDTDIPHSLYENLAHKRPFAFQLNQNKYEVKTWIEVLVKTSEFLISNNAEIFAQFEKDPKMNGKKSKYFSKDTVGLRKPVKLNGIELFMETNMSANSIRNLIVKMLQRYNYKTADFTLYFRADYSSLHS